VRTDNVDLVVDVSNARNPSHSFLDELLQVKTGQPAGKIEVFPFLFHAHVTQSAAEMRVLLQVLAGQQGEVGSLWSFSEGRLN